MSFLIIGGTRGLGQAFAKALKQRGPVIVTGRTPTNDFKYLQMDIEKEDSIQQVAQTLKDSQTKLQKVIYCPGYLQPEKSLAQLNEADIHRHFAVNTFGAMLCAKHLSPLLAHPSQWINMSARTGSIGDNHLGGWYSYRMSKAALNQLTKCMAIELGRKKTTVISLHPGTVDTDLSRPFVKKAQFTPQASVEQMLHVIDRLELQDNGKFLDYQGKEIVW